ncbi:MAG: hypothetical protein HQ498_03730 [Pseudohongiella sp.]|nr:hypothetical protein [Pseudohongiella sp.]
MSLEFNLLDKTDYLLCEVRGNHDDPQDSIDFFLEILLHCRASAAPRVLIDMRKAGGNISAVNKIIFYEKIIDKYEIYLKFGGLPIRMVFVVNADNIADYNPGLDVAVRRKFPAMITDGLREAIDWLAETEVERNSVALEY